MSGEAGSRETGSGWSGRLVTATLVLGVLSVAADFLYHKHGHYSFEEIPGFHAGLGFLASVGLVLVAVLVRKLVMRGEDYYQPADEPEGRSPEDSERV